MPFSSAHDAQVKLYNVVYSYNGIKRNFKQVEMKDSNIISFIYRGHDTVIYNLVGNHTKIQYRHDSKATSNIGTWLLSIVPICGS